MSWHIHKDMSFADSDGYGAAGLVLGVIMGIVINSSYPF